MAPCSRGGLRMFEGQGRGKKWGAPTVCSGAPAQRKSWCIDSELEGLNHVVSTGRTLYLILLTESEAVLLLCDHLWATNLGQVFFLNEGYNPHVTHHLFIKAQKNQSWLGFLCFFLLLFCFFVNIFEPLTHCARKARNWRSGATILWTAQGGIRPLMITLSVSSRGIRLMINIHSFSIE